ncbi:MAG: 50S ribosomal protein L25/general stress protein Ctc [Bacteroidetes bacterium]|nr:50S ribosomal protein L25/general stress protein Ctc [Bacteroidota bacterium]
MKSVEIKGNLRNDLGKSSSKNLRKQDQIPCVLYGNGENVHFHTHENSFKEIVYTPNAYLVTIDIEGKQYQAVLRDIQYHPVTDKILHVDFFQVHEKEPVWIRVPVVLEGSSIGVLNGGRLVQKMRKVRIKGVPSALPDELKIDISNLAIGKSIKIADLQIEGLEFLEPENAVVVLVKTARSVVLPEDEEGEEGEEGEGEEGETSEGEGGDAPAEESAE